MFCLNTGTREQRQPQVRVLPKHQAIWTSSWTFRTTTPSQSEIFSVIVACSLCSYVLAFQDYHTLQKWNMLNYCSLFSACMYWPFSTTTPSQSEIFSVIVACFLCSYVLAFEYHNTLPKWNILCYYSLLSLLQLQRAERIRYNNREYFTLGGCCCLEGSTISPYHLMFQDL